jgi:hypothetical protein
MNTAFETTPSPSTEDSRKRARRGRDLDSAELQRLAGPTQPTRFDLLNVLLPEWPAQACSWA